MDVFHIVYHDGEYGGPIETAGEQSQSCKHLAQAWTRLTVVPEVMLDEDPDDDDDQDHDGDKDDEDPGEHDEHNHDGDKEGRKKAPGCS